MWRRLNFMTFCKTWIWYAAHPKSSHSRITTIPCGITLRILNLPLAHNHNSLHLVKVIASPYNVIFWWLASCLARSLQAHPLWQQWQCFWRFSKDFRPLAKDFQRFWTFSKSFWILPKIAEDKRKFSRKNWWCFNYIVTHMSTTKGLYSYSSGDI